MISKTWLKLPVVVRAVVVGMIVQIVGVYSFGLLASLNLQLLPSVPWSVPVELAVLWLLVHYLNGRWWPLSTSASRRERLRMRPVPLRMLPTTIGTGVAFGCALFCQGVFSYRLVEMPKAAGGALLTFLAAPPLTAIGIMIAGVVMTGIVEEAAFRGYMQQPIEQRHGPVPAIFLVAVLFTAVHMPPLPMLPLFIFGSLGWGVYVRLAGSTLPAMVVHAAIDAVSFTVIFIEPDFLPALLAASTLQNGMDAPSWIALSGALVFGALAIFGFVRMARLGSTEREEQAARQLALEETV